MSWLASPSTPPDTAMSSMGKLRSAEGALAFLQAEHRAVLEGLHGEIAGLQQKCSDLQFSQTTCDTSARNEAELRSQVQSLTFEAEAKDQRIGDLESRLQERNSRAEELEQQLRWKTVEFESAIEGKTAKIAQLQRSLAVKDEVGRLQQQVQQLYHEREAEMEERMKDVSRRARTPSVVAKVTASEFRQTASNNNEADGRQQPNSLDSYSTQQRPFSVSEVTQAATAPMLRSVPDPASTRSKVFRHKLQKTLKQQTSMVEPPFLIQREDTARSVSPCGNGSNGNAGSRTHSLINLRQHRKSLPHDYKSVVATLPPIPGQVLPSATGERRRVSKTIDERGGYPDEESEEAELSESPALRAASGSSERPITESFA